MLACTTPEQLEAFLSSYEDPSKQARQRELVAKGVESPLVGYALWHYHRIIGQIDDALATAGPWLAGETFSLADTGLFPYLNRFHDLGLDRLWQGRAKYLDWVARMKARPSYAKAIGNVVDPKVIEFSQSCVAKVKPQLDAIMAEL